MGSLKPNYVNEPDEFANLSSLQFTLREMRGIFSKPRFWIGFVAIVFVLAISGPFYTAINLNFPERLSYWLLISGVSFCIGLFISLFIGVWLFKRGLSRLVAQSIAGLFAGVPIAGIVWLTGNTIFGFNPGSSLLDGSILVAQCSVISATVALLFAMFQSNDSEETGQKQEATASSSFLKRLSIEIGKDLISINAQDHYLKVTTTKGSEMLLMRMADACEELSEFEGLQVHRSWWVASGHIQSFEKNAGKGTLTTSDGQKVPVSRGFLKNVEAAFG